MRVAMDVDRASLRALPRRSAHPTHRVVADGEALPFRARSFGLVITRVALPYMNVPVALWEMSRVLRADGEVWMTLHPVRMAVMRILADVKALRFKDLLYQSYAILNGLVLHVAGRLFRFPLNRRRMESVQTWRGVARALTAAGFCDLQYERVSRGAGYREADRLYGKLFVVAARTRGAGDSSLNILYIYQGEWPRAATRVAKQVRSLVKAGHTVHLLARNYDRRARTEPWEGATVHRLPTVPFGPLNRLLNFPLFLNPAWLWAIWRAARRNGAVRLVVADLPLAPLALWLGRLLGTPVHYDMAEVYPAFLQSLHLVARRPLWDHVIRSPWAAALVERYVLRRVTSVSVVSEESRRRCVQLGARPEQVVLVGNTPDNVEELTRRHPFPAELGAWVERRRILFVGTLLADRGVKEAVEAVKLVTRQVPDAALIIVGDGPDRPRIARTIERLGLSDSVALLGWHDHGRLAQFYQHCQVGLLPFLDTPHVRITLANKLFDYMGASLAVLAADLPPMERIVAETGAGLLYPVGSTEALAAQLVGLLREPDRCRRLGERGREAVVTKYNWGRDEAVWLRIVGGAAEPPRPLRRRGDRTALLVPPAKA